jgi:hypothetical protein
VTVLAFAAAVVLPAVIGKGLPNIVRSFAIAGAIALVAVLILSFAVPHPFKDAAADVDASAPGCSSTRVPAWWPTWLARSRE